MADTARELSEARLKERIEFLEKALRRGDEAIALLADAKKCVELVNVNGYYDGWLTRCKRVIAGEAPAPSGRAVVALAIYFGERLDTIFWVGDGVCTDPRDTIQWATDRCNGLNRKSETLGNGRPYRIVALAPQHEEPAT